MFTVRKKGRGLYLARTFSSNAPPTGSPVLSSVEFGGKKWREREERWFKINNLIMQRGGNHPSVLQIGNRLENPLTDVGLFRSL